VENREAKVNGSSPQDIFIQLSLPGRFHANAEVEDILPHPAPLPPRGEGGFAVLSIGVRSRGGGVKRK